MAGIEARPTLRHLKQLAESKIREAKERVTHSRLITRPPLSPLGYQLHLKDNIPSQLTPEERATAEAKIARDLPKLQREGAFNPPKVNIVGAEVVNQKDRNGQLQQTIEYTTAPSNYFLHRSGIDATTPYETARRLSHSGASIIAITGDNKIVLSSRPDKVQLYPRTFAATASGSWDGVIQQSRPGQPDLLVPPTPENAISHIKKELHEETGLPTNVIDAPESKLTILGIAEDQIKKHRDILYMIELPKNITSAEMRMFHKEEQVNGNGHTDNDPMAAHLMFLPATPNAIADLLTLGHAPWDATARESLLLTGYMLRMRELIAKGYSQEKAVKRANQWRQFIQWQVGLNQTINIDGKARKARRMKIRRAKWRIAKAKLGALRGKDTAEEERVARYDLQKYRARPRGYDVHRPPAKQNLPEVKDDARRLGFNGQDELVERKRRKSA